MRCWLARRIPIALEVYSLVFLFPILITILDILFIGILGLPPSASFSHVLYQAWIGFFFTGDFYGAPMWRVQLFLIVSSYLLTVLLTLDDEL